MKSKVEILYTILDIREKMEYNVSIMRILE